MSPHHNLATNQFIFSSLLQKWLICSHFFSQMDETWQRQQFERHKMVFINAVPTSICKTSGDCHDLGLHFRRWCCGSCQKRWDYEHRNDFDVKIRKWSQGHKSWGWLQGSTPGWQFPPFPPVDPPLALTSCDFMSIAGVFFSSFSCRQMTSYKFTIISNKAAAKKWTSVTVQKWKA